MKRRPVVIEAVERAETGRESGPADE